jgi:nucleotide-binding universal stress UspA family protein
MFNKILLAYDGSDGAKLALDKAAEMAKAAAADFHLLAVGRIPEYAQTGGGERTRDEVLFKDHGGGR